MKLRRLLAAATAAVVAASVVTVTSSAANFNGLDEAGQYCLLSNDSHVPALTDASLVDDIVGFKLVIKPQDFRAFGKELSDPVFWYGGGFGVNSTSTGWKSLGEWSFQDGAKDLTFKAGDKKGEYYIEYTQDAPMFTANETYAFIWFQDWTGTYAIDVIDFDVYDADGNNLFEVTVDTPAEPEAPETPVEPETPAEPTEEPVEPTEEPVESVEPTEEPVESVEPTEEPVESEEPTVEADPTVEAEPASTDLADYFDGGTVFLFGEDGGYCAANDMDLTDVYGVKFNVTFDDAELADENVWVGGGVGANSDSTGWEQHEWGKASGKKEITPDFENGTITWFNGEPIFTADETYAQLWIQTWGGKVTVDSVELLYADYEAPAVDTPADTETPADTNTGKDSPETGVEGIAVALGAVALAGVAVVASRKRK